MQQRFLPFENCRSFVLSRSRTEFSIAGSNEGMHEKEGKGGKKKKTMVTGIGPRSYGATLRDKSNHFATRNDLINRSHVASSWRAEGYRLPLGRQKAPRQIVDQIEEAARARGSPPIRTTRIRMYICIYIYIYTYVESCKRNTRHWRNRNET